MNAYPLDLQDVSYSYLERPNRSILWLLKRRQLLDRVGATILDVGCGCGANARAIRESHPSVTIIGIEPDPRAAQLAGEVCDTVFTGTLEAWLESGAETREIDVVILSDVLEHIPDPVHWLRSMSARAELSGAAWIISVPNYAVWYNRVRTLLGRFEYQWSGLYDRTHLRFYTRRSVRRLLEYCGFSIEADRCTASIVQSVAPLLRRSFTSELEAGDHLALMDTSAYRFYRRLIEPVEEAICNLWKGLLGFQIVVVVTRQKP
jgi:trans-aconitate methyltransferase